MSLLTACTLMPEVNMRTTAMGVLLWQKFYSLARVGTT